MRRVSVVGGTGSGKTTFGRKLAGIMDVPFIELDAINWGPGWTMIGSERFQQIVRERIAADAWVVDGNYGGRGVRPLVWERADTIVWLDFSLWVMLRRLWGRTISRIRDRSELWPETGNRESIRGAFFSTESLFWWAVKSHRTRRRNYPRLIAEAAAAGKTVHRFTRPADADRWLETERARAAGRI